MRVLLAEDEDLLRARRARRLREHAYAVDEAADGEDSLVSLDVQRHSREGALCA